jgi:hypothetical protein
MKEIDRIERLEDKVEAIAEYLIYEYDRRKKDRAEMWLAENLMKVIRGESTSSDDS